MRTTESQNPALAASLAATVGFCSLIWAFLASGTVFGLAVSDSADGWLASDATTAAPAAPAFAIWFPIYLGLAGYLVWQWLPANRGQQLHRRVRGWAVASMALNALWLQMVQLDQLGLSLIVMLLLAAVLTTVIRVVSSQVLYSATDRWITRATFGIYLGWIVLAAIANLVAWLGSLGNEMVNEVLKVCTALVILLAGLAVCALTFKNPMGIYVNAGSLWAVAWIAVARFTGPLQSASVALCASIAAALMLICLLTSVRHRLRHLLGVISKGTGQR